MLMKNCWPLSFMRRASQDEPYSPPVFPEMISSAYGTVTSNTSVSVSWPAGVVADRIALLHVTMIDSIGSASINEPSGWGTIDNEHLAVAGDYDGALFWKRLTGSESGSQAVTFSESIDTGLAQAALSIWEGCITTGDPWEAVTLSAQGSTTNHLGALVTTLGPGRTVVSFFGSNTTATGEVQESEWTEEYEQTTTTGSDGNTSCFSREALEPGDYYPTLVLKTASCVNVGFTIALIPEVEGTGLPPLGEPLGQEFLTTPGAGTWTVPEDFNPNRNTIELIGAGGCSGAARSTGGSGGQYARLDNYDPGVATSISYFVGIGATTNDRGTAASPGDKDTWFDDAATVAYAQGGADGAVTASPAANTEGPVGSCLTHNGGRGGLYVSSGQGSGGGGGAGGPYGAGKSGGNFNSTSSGNGGGGGGANGNLSTVGQQNGNAENPGGAGPDGTGGGTGSGSNPAGSGTSGKGAGGAGGTQTGGAGSTEDHWDTGVGPGGGGGGGGHSTGSARGGAGANYGGGGGGNPNAGSSSTNFGGQGIIVITWYAE